MKPIRVQRKRTKGWKMPENTIYVGRPSFYGNPFKVGQTYKTMDDLTVLGWGEALQYMTGPLTKIIDNSDATEMFEKWVNRNPFAKEDLEKLRGKNLACFCALDKPCHADILLKLANE